MILVGLSQTAGRSPDNSGVGSKNGGATDPVNSGQPSQYPPKNLTSPLGPQGTANAASSADLSAHAQQPAGFADQKPKSEALTAPSTAPSTVPSRSSGEAAVAGASLPSDPAKGSGAPTANPAQPKSEPVGGASNPEGVNPDADHANLEKEPSADEHANGKIEAKANDPHYPEHINYLDTSILVYYSGKSMPLSNFLVSGGYYLWVESTQGLMQYASMPQSSIISLIAYSSSASQAMVYELYPTSESTQGIYTQNVYNLYAGYNRLQFSGAKAGRHVLMFVVH